MLFATAVTYSTWEDFGMCVFGDSLPPAIADIESGTFTFLMVLNA